MRFRRSTISLLMIVSLLMGCDGNDFSEWASPQIRVSFDDQIQGQSAGKSSAILQVELQVRTLGGRDYSPESVTVNTATTSQVVFDVSIPADSIYTFLVRFTGTGGLVGEGAAIQEVTLETTVVNITVHKPSATVPSIAFLPSRVNASVGSGTVGISIRYYGAAGSTAGIAASFDITGPTPRPFTVSDADLSFVEGRKLNAAWQFAQDIQGGEIGTLVISLAQTADFCLEAGTDDIRVVDRNGNVTTASLLGTCISVRP